MTSPSTVPGALPTSPIAALRQVYERKHRSSEFQEEESVLVELIPKLQEALAPVYDLGEPFSLGSTATLWKVHDRSLNKERALKLPRPRQAKMSDIISVVRGERDKLASLNHQNLIKVYFAKEVPLGDYIFPFYVMEYLPGVQDLDKFIVANLHSLSGDDIAGFFHDVLAGLSYLHRQGVIHCDIKPANLLIAPGAGVLIADLGYAKYLHRLPQPDGSLTEVVYTRAYAHPDLRRRVTRSSDPDANRSPILQSDLRVAFDMFALGRTIQETLETIRGTHATSGVPPPFNAYQWLYLTYVAKRLLDGQIDPQRSSEDSLLSDVIPGVPAAAMQDLKYASAEDALDDLQKLLHLYDLEGVVPELNPNISTYIRVPHANVPMTSRVKSIIDHPSFRRLGQVTQLGFVSWVYPGATHTRLEHVLGTFAQCCRYVRALWYDENSCFFQSTMTERHLKLVLLAALLHDVAQYPMAHELTEVASEFGHERFTAHMLFATDSEDGVSLRDIVEGEWCVSIEDLLHVLDPSDDSPYRLRLLHSLISGPLDCDKLDYLQRDATHIGVSFGDAIDDHRLLRNLTTVFGIEKSGGDNIVISELGVGEKALAVAEALVRARKDMFRQVYWHHTVRALKAMLAFVVRDVLVGVSAANKEEEFWKDFVDIAFSGTWRRSRDRTDAAGDAQPDGSDGETAIVGGEHQQTSPRGLLPTDDDLLWFFRDYASDTARTVVDAIRRRRLYRRLAVLSAAQPEIRFNNIYGQFRTYRLDGKPKDIEDKRAKWELKLIEKAKERLQSASGFDVPRRERVQAFLAELRPLVLVDVPVKAAARGKREQVLWFVPEDAVGVHARERGEEPRMDKAKLDLDQEHFDRDVGKIRVFAHPRAQADLAALLTDKDIFGILSA